MYDGIEIVRVRKAGIEGDSVVTSSAGGVFSIACAFNDNNNSNIINTIMKL
jgi:hypothetical protein